MGSGFLDASSLDSLEDLLSATDMRAVEGDRLLILKHGDVWKRMTVGFKMDETHWDPRIEAQRSWFISRQPYLDRLSARASRYLYHTVKKQNAVVYRPSLHCYRSLKVLTIQLRPVVLRRQDYGSLSQVPAVFTAYVKPVSTMAAVMLLSRRVQLMSFRQFI